MSGDFDRSLRLPRDLDASELEDEGATTGEHCVAASTSSLEGESDDLVETDNDRFCDCCGALGIGGNCFGKAAGEGGLMYARGEAAAG